MTTHDTTPWIKWTGGQCPVDADQRVEVRLADGEILCGRATDFTWFWFPPYKTLRENVNRNIVAYRKTE